MTLHFTPISLWLVSFPKGSWNKPQQPCTVWSYFRLSLCVVQNLFAKCTQQRRNPPCGSDRIPAEGGSLPALVMVVVAANAGEEFQVLMFQHAVRFWLLSSCCCSFCITALGKHVTAWKLTALLGINPVIVDVVSAWARRTPVLSCHRGGHLRVNPGMSSSHEVSWSGVYPPGLILAS